MNKPKVVIFDLETLPDPREIYRRIPSIGNWPGRTFKAELQTIMCFGYKIEGEEAKCINVWDYSDDFHNDSALVSLASEILADADEIVTHNGKRFDVKVLNTRLAFWGLPPINKTKHVDTKQVCKSHLSLYSNSLAEAAKFFGIANKMTFSNKWGMWERLAFNDHTKEDLKVMTKYCIQDVEVTHQLYLKTKPFHGTQAVNRNLWVDGEKHVCNTCGCDKLIGHGTVPRTKGKVTQRWLCKACGSTCNTIIKKAKLKAVI